MTTRLDRWAELTARYARREARRFDAGIDRNVDCRRALTAFGALLAMIDVATPDQAAELRDLLPTARELLQAKAAEHGFGHDGRGLA